MNRDKSELIRNYAGKIVKALARLEYSHKKVEKISPNDLSDESLEVWESYSARLARVVDLFLTKYLKARVLQEDPAFEGTLRDFCNFGEKMKLVDSAEAWVMLRELRNTTAHDYEDEDLAGFYQRLKNEAGRVLKLRDILNANP